MVHLWVLTHICRVVKALEKDRVDEDIYERVMGFCDAYEKATDEIHYPPSCVINADETRLSIASHNLFAKPRIVNRGEHKYGAESDKTGAHVLLVVS